MQQRTGLPHLLFHFATLIKSIQTRQCALCADASMVLAVNVCTAFLAENPNTCTPQMCAQLIRLVVAHLAETMEKMSTIRQGHLVEKGMVWNPTLVALLSLINELKKQKIGGYGCLTSLWGIGLSRVVPNSGLLNSALPLMSSVFFLAAGVLSHQTFDGAAPSGVRAPIPDR